MHWSSIVFLVATLIVIGTAALTIWIERKRQRMKDDLARTGDDHAGDLRVDRRDADGL